MDSLGQPPGVHATCLMQVLKKLQFWMDSLGQPPGMHATCLIQVPRRLQVVPIVERVEDNIRSECVKPNMIAQGADQFKQDNPRQLEKLSTYFNAAYFSFSVGELIALTILVWVQTHSGMDIGFGVSAAVMEMGFISLISGTLYYRNKTLQGSILTSIAEVLVAVFWKRKQVCPSNPLMLHWIQNKVPENPILSADSAGSLQYTKRFRFLDKASVRILNGTDKESPWRLCSVTQIEQVKILVSVIPIFACTIVFNTILAQLQTISVEQGSAMNTKLTNNFPISPASLHSIPYIMLIFIVPLYDTFFVPFARKFTSHESGIPHQKRISCGLFLATFFMISAALVEKKRRDASLKSNETLSIFWITPQFLIFGFSEMLTAVGLIEFFYKQSLKAMQAFLTAMSYCSYSFGFYLSSVLVSSPSLANSFSNANTTEPFPSDSSILPEAPACTIGLQSLTTLRYLSCFFSYNLEDKVVLWAAGNVMTQVKNATSAVS